MKRKNHRGGPKVVFEISRPGQDEKSQARAVGFSEFARMAPEVTMKRRGFLSLTLFAQAAALAAATPALGGEKDQKGMLHAAIPSIVLVTDFGAGVVCIQEAGSNRQICAKVVPPKGHTYDAIKTLDPSLAPDTPTVFFVPDLGVSASGVYPVASLGKVTRVDQQQQTVCAKNTVRGNEVCAPLMHGAVRYKDEYLDALGSIKPGDTALFYEHYDDNAFSRLPLSLRVIHLKNGGRIPCQESWIEDRMLRYSTGFGTVAVPLAQVDLAKSARDTVQTQVEESFARNASSMSRRAEARAREAAEKSRKVLMLDEEEERQASMPEEGGKPAKKEKEAPPAQAAPPPKTTGGKRTEVWKRFDETDDCGNTSPTCSCVPVCYY